MSNFQETEDLISSANSTTQIRSKLLGVEDDAERKVHARNWQESVRGLADRFHERFARLRYGGLPVHVLPPEEQLDIDGIKDVVQLMFPDWKPHMTGAADVATVTSLQNFKQQHLELSTYLIVVKKCGDIPNCKWCTPLIAPKVVFEELGGRPQLLPLPQMQSRESGDCTANTRYKTYEEMCHLCASSERDMPTFSPAAAPTAEAKQLDKAASKSHGIVFKPQTRRSTIVCTECEKPRLIYSKTRLSHDQRDSLDKLLDVDRLYVCGEPLFPPVAGEDPRHELDGIVFIRRALVCRNHVERNYYPAVGNLKLPPCCLWCGGFDEANLATPAEVAARNPNGRKYLPMCRLCYNKNLDLVLIGPAPNSCAKRSSTKGAANVSKHKRQKGGIAEAFAGASVVQQTSAGGDDESTGDEGEAQLESTEATSNKSMPQQSPADGNDDKESSDDESVADIEIDVAPAVASCSYAGTDNCVGEGGMITKPCCGCGDPVHHLCGITTPELSSFYGELQAGSHFCYWCCIMAALLEEKLEPAAAVNLLDPNHDYALAVMPPSSTTIVHLMASGVLLRWAPPQVHNVVCELRDCPGPRGPGLVNCTFCNVSYHVGCMPINNKPVGPMSAKCWMWSCKLCVKEASQKMVSRAKRGGAQIVAGRTAPKKRRPTPATKAITLAALRKYKVGELRTKLGELKLSTTGTKQALFNRLAGHLKLG